MSNEVVYTNAYLWIQGKDVAQYATDVTLNVTSESLDASAMGAGYRKHKGGVLDYTFDIKFLYDRSTSGPTALLYSLVGTTACIEYRPQNVCSTVSNPSFFGIVTLESLPLGGAFGTMLTVPAKFNAYTCLNMASSS